MSRARDLLRRAAFAVPLIGPRYRMLWNASELLHRINPGHYGSPIPSAEEIERQTGIAVDTQGDSLPGILLRTEEQLALLRSLRPFVAEHPFTAKPTSANRYYFDNDWFQYTDALVLYGLLRLWRPRRIVEIGSGFSSCVILDTIQWGSSQTGAGQTDLGVAPVTTLIEPDSERLRSRLRVEDDASIELVDAILQDVSLDLFDQLGGGDILLVDSSHISKCGSDVNRVVFEILPRLQPGVLVHFHDIYFPFEYPRRLLEQHQFFNEAYLLRAFLEQNEQFQIVLWNDYLKTQHEAELSNVIETTRGDIACSFWMKRVGTEVP